MVDRKDFATQKDFLAHIVKNKAQLMNLKKAEAKSADVAEFTMTDHPQAVSKMITSTKEDDLENGSIFRTVIGNTYGWMDSHGDVHIPGIFTKSIQENKNIAHLRDHEFKLSAKVGDPKKIYEDLISWKALGINKKGNATCLLMDTNILKEYDEKIFVQYVKKKINQHSVRMVYVKLYLCVNDEEYKDEFANWNNYIDYVANEDEALDKGYFWAITEAKLIEISCVIAGSNILTGTIEPVKTTQSTNTTEPSPDTRKLNYEYLTNNLKLS